MIHFDWTITLGNALTLLCALAYIVRFDRLLTKFLIEHEILMIWYCRVNDITPDQLPTRSKK